MAETLLREAHSASLIYGLPNSVMILAGNAGFGGANNAAARSCAQQPAADRQPGCLSARSRLGQEAYRAAADGRRPTQTRLFGVPLYYDDGSLMHGGMYFEIDAGLSDVERQRRLHSAFAASSITARARRPHRRSSRGRGRFPPSPARSFRIEIVTGSNTSADSPRISYLAITRMRIFACEASSGGVAPWLHDIRCGTWRARARTRAARRMKVARWSIAGCFRRTWMAT